jgi:hypothetical protein
MNFGPRVASITQNAARTQRDVGAPKCDGDHIEQFALVREYSWPGGEASKSALLPRCVLRAGLFFELTQHSVAVFVRVSEAPPSPAYCEFCPTAKCHG